MKQIADNLNALATQPWFFIIIAVAMTIAGVASYGAPSQMLGSFNIAGLAVVAAAISAKKN